MANIGIMGGTFDPIHNAHLMIGRQAYEEYKLDEIWFMPSGTPPHKKDHHVTDVEDRCEMVRLAIEDSPYYKLSEFEARRDGNTYTAETLCLLREQYPQHRFFFIIGADSLFQIEHWYHPELVMIQTTLLVAGREYADAPCTMDEQIAYLTKRYQADIRILHSNELDIASADLRRMIAEDQPIDSFVPKAVADYIARRNLYHAK
ncbi:MAG: nicotinate-nucleotide adenylyltransferase [Brotaphodocola sp.]